MRAVLNTAVLARTVPSTEYARITSIIGGLLALALLLLCGGCGPPF
jgi:hypothetical protein